MSHFGRSGPPDIRDTFSLLVLNITFRTTADDLFPLFDKYGKVVDVFIPRDRRTGDSRGFAFVRYKYAEEARKAVDRLDGRVVDGREIMVQFAKFGPNAERITCSCAKNLQFGLGNTLLLIQTRAILPETCKQLQSGRIVESSSKIKGRSRSRSPRPRYRDGYRDKDRDRDYRRRSRSRSRDRYDRDGYRGRDRDYHPRSVSHSPDHRKECGRGHDEKRHRRSQSYGSPNSPRSPSPHRAHPRDGSPNGRNDNKRSPNGSPNSPRSPSPHRAHPRDGSPNARNDNKRSPTSKSVSPCNEPVDS
ncbi:serine/arginine-rich splicing factor SC35-like isoform X4 [Populus alba x Populus x berolinensis]|nr:serine/arginine-rich splicing factor SC35-like isoform X4 [Populus alba x Populus x berolinensis]